MREARGKRGGSVGQLNHESGKGDRPGDNRSGRRSRGGWIYARKDSGTVESYHHAFRQQRCGYHETESRVYRPAGCGSCRHEHVKPFYGRGGEHYPNFQDYRRIGSTVELETRWDEVAQAPYLANKDGLLVCGYENPRSLAVKCQYILDKGLLGGMFWDYAGDNTQCDLLRTMYESLIVSRKGKAAPYQVLVLTERGGQHGGFTDAGMQWLARESEALNFEMTEINHAKPITEEFLNRFHLVIQLDFPPYTWSDEAQQAFIKYIEEGRGGWIGFHHATLLGEFDGYPMWQWFSDFMGDVRFKNYIAPLADGVVVTEDAEHPVMKGLPGTFVVPDDEWYTYDKSPRRNVHVLAHVDEYSYTPASDVKMGDHPVVWVNEGKKARNVYFQMGHSKKLYETEAFTTMFRNAIQWVFNR